jgi:hypothetical protein
LKLNALVHFTNDKPLFNIFQLISEKCIKLIPSERLTAQQLKKEISKIEKSLVPDFDDTLLEEEGELLQIPGSSEKVRKVSPFIIFSMEKSKNFRDLYPTLKPSEIQVKVGEVWRGFSDAQKKVKKKNFYIEF